MSRLHSRIGLPMVLISATAGFGLAQWVNSVSGAWPLRLDPVPAAYADESGEEAIRRHCDSTYVAARVEELLKVLTGFEPEFVEIFFGGDDAPFVWFTLNDLRNDGLPSVDAFTRDEVESYFASRPLDRVDFGLTETKFVHSNTGIAERGNVGFNISFQVHDSGSGERLAYGSGKGEYHCRTSSFMVVSLAIRAGTRAPATGYRPTHLLKRLDGFAFSRDLSDFPPSSTRTENVSAFLRSSFGPHTTLSRRSPMGVLSP